MSLLRDVDLVDELQANPGLITGMHRTPAEELYSRTSQIQPSSIDLRIGQISVPAAVATHSSKKILDGDHVLEPGNTAMVETLETLNLPKTLAAIGFPPSHISVKGLLMTNPGHIDPGYRGKLHLTVINMSRSPIVLRCGDTILTVIFYRLTGECKVGYAERREQTSSKSDPSVLLSPDFLDVTKRAQDIADAAVKKSAIYAGLIALLITVASQALPYYFDTKKDIAVMEERIKVLQDKVDILDKTSTGVPANPNGAPVK